MPKSHSNNLRKRPIATRKSEISSANAQTFESKFHSSSKPYSISYSLALIAIFFAVSYFHFNYVYRLFENDKHFSHLSTLERELSFRTEMGLYYSYFKQISVESPSFIDGFISILSDNRTEAPTTINVLERFNLYPEVLLSLIYRSMKYFDILTEICYQVNRGPDMSPIQSCEGHKEPTYFYVTCIFLLNGALLGILFLFGTYFSKSILGGIITILAYMFNHAEATRVMWAPPLRESFSFPFQIVQLLIMTSILKERRVLVNLDSIRILSGQLKKHDISNSEEIQKSQINPKSKIRLVLLLSGSTILYMLPWQFAQFTLATQLMALGLLYILHLLPLDQFLFITSTQILSLIITAFLMFGNTMLLTSLFSTSLFSFYLTGLVDFLILCFASKTLHFSRLFGIVRRIVLFLGSFFLIKLIIINQLFSSPDDDAHVWDILKSKLIPSYRTFDTQLYTCAKEFDFIDMETVWKLCTTGLVPLVLIILIRFMFDFILDVFGRRDPHRAPVYNHYHLIQTGVYTLMGILIMRLKLFPVPQYCLMISHFMNDAFWPKKFIERKQRKFFIFIFIIIAMGFQGRKNIQEQLKIKGEYANIPMESMIEWINKNTANDSIFAGTMPTMANLKLSTGRAIVLHPHYEHRKIRRRVKQMYTIYSRKPLRHVHSILKEYEVDYLVYESHWCTITNRPRGCSYPEMYDFDEEDPKILKRTTLACQTLESNPQPYFQKLFSHDYLNVYAVL